MNIDNFASRHNFVVELEYNIIVVLEGVGLLEGGLVVVGERGRWGSK